MHYCFIEHDDVNYADPANDQLCYKPCIDINELITVDDVIEQFDLGPNGALVYSMKYLKQNVNWLVERVNKLDSDTYLLIDCPGQVCVQQFFSLLFCKCNDVSLDLYNI